MQQYQWLLFDADNTLFDYDRAEGIAFQQVFHSAGIAYDPEYLAIYQRINSVLWPALEKGEITLDLIKVRRFELLLQATGIQHSPAALSDSYIECLAARPELVAGAAEMLEALRGKYRVAILTNGLKVAQRGRLSKSTIQHHIAEVIISEEVGFSKPAKEFFDAAFTKLGQPARRDVLMIGDGWGSDITGALQYGLDACWYNPTRKPRPATGQLTREIASWHELVEWLG